MYWIPEFCNTILMMKKLFAFVLLSTSILCSCQKFSYLGDGDWAPIKLSQSEVFFDADGGSCTVESINYGCWWINGIRITGTETYYFADPGEKYTYLTASGDGISAKIGINKNTVVITVNPSTEKHDWSVEMEAGDAFTSIRVKQN